MKIPTRQRCIELLVKNKTPINVIEHVKSVCKVAEEIVDSLQKKGKKVNRELVIAAALLHDIEREKKNHVIEGGKLLRLMGYNEVAEVTEKHSLYQLDREEVQPKTIEEKIVFYADKRVKGSEIVTVEERFADLKIRYNLEHLDRELEYTKRIEKELLG